MSRHTNYPSLPAPRYCCLSCPRLALSTRSRPPSCSHSSRSPKERTSSRYVVYREPGVCDANPRQACLNAPEPSSDNANGVDGDNPVESPEDNHAQVPAGQPRMPPGSGIPQAYMTPEAALHYQQYLQQQQPSTQYPGMPQGGMPRHPAQHYSQDQKLS